MPELRVLDRIARPMQRLGYLKHLLRRVVASNTSNLENLGQDLIETVSRKVNVLLDAERAAYVRVRLFDNAYATLKKQVDAWQKAGGDPSLVALEMQDLYLADPSLPSGVGKLSKEDWKRYPPLAINIGLVRAGTYSANTRALSFSHFISEIELRAFNEYSPDINPLKLAPSQALLLLYAFLENDGEAVIPLWQALAAQYPGAIFNDRQAGNLLPEIYQAIIKRQRGRVLSADFRERLNTLEKSSEFIIRARQTERYAGGSAREEASRVRLEPYVDIGLFDKPDRLKYEFSFNRQGLAWVQALEGVSAEAEISAFLHQRFFQTAARAWEISALPLATPDEIVPRLRQAARRISSPGGYTPIEELGLVAGIDALLNERRWFEIALARETLIAYQKANPYKVRFTVDRMGVLAHARFMEETA
jgi:hypothetical protein